MKRAKGRSHLLVTHKSLVQFRRVAETLAIATAGAFGLGLTGVPGGYLSGAILLVACAALAGRPMLIPVPLMRVIFVLLGTSLGAVVTPATLHGMAAYPLSIAILLVAMACIGVGAATYLRVVHGWDKVDAYLASAPGGMSQVLVVAADVGADLRAIAIVQSMRVVIVAVGLPSGLAMLGLVGHVSRPLGAPMTLAGIDELAILTAVATCGAYIANRFNLPGGLLFGAMFASAGLHGSGLIQVALPWWAANAAAIALGAIIGARFANMRFRLFVAYLGAAFGSFGVAVTIAGIFAAGLLTLIKLPIAEVMIAFAPGSVDAMMLLALALHLDPVYVGAHHVMRIFFVALAMPIIARRETAKKQSASEAGE
jgi:membrane AbrB-like protein